MLACLAPAQAPAPGWIASEQGCLLWNPAPRSEESVVWEGPPCPGRPASGPGVVRWFEAGALSEIARGHFEDGRLEGPGSWTWSSGHRYQGQFARGQFDGEGSFTWPDGSKYRGEFRRHERHGHGVHEAANGARYEGPYVRGQRHGTGRCHEPGGGWHRCRWHRGKRVDDPLQARGGPALGSPTRSSTKAEEARA